jgi:hypothetical protein
VLWGVPVLIFALAFSHGWVRVWDAVGIPSYMPIFLDLRAITSGVVVAHSGGDPMVSNPLDPLHRSLNYPRIWLHLFSALGIDDHNAVIVGILFCFFYLICLSTLIVKAKSGWEALILLVAGLSLSPLFGIERGNTDLFVFSLVFLAASSGSKYLRWGALAFASMLKLFPLAAMGSEVIRRPSKQKLIPAALACLLVALFVCQWHDLKLIRHATPVTNLQSYGVLSLRLQVEEFFSGLSLDSLRPFLQWSVPIGCWLAAGIAAGVVWFRRPGADDVPQEPTKSGELFAIFGSIYAFSFLLGSNWDYRLIFLIPTLPFAMDLARNPRYKWRGVGYILMVLVAENSLGAQSYHSAVWGHIATFVLFIAIVEILTEQAKPLLLRQFSPSQEIA